MRLKTRITILLCYFCSSSFAQSKNVNFLYLKNWDEVKATAKAKQKIIFMDVNATWCGPCKKMESDLRSNEVASALINTKFIALKIQIDTTAADSDSIQMMYSLSKEIKDRYKITSLPTFLFFEKDGTLIHKEQGYQNIDSLVSLLKTALDSQKNDFGMIKLLKKKQLHGDKLFNFCMRMKQLKEDSISLLAAKTYKENEINNHSKKTLTTETIHLIRMFPTIFSSKDYVISYIYKHKSEVDKKANETGFSNNILNTIINREEITPYLQNGQNPPNWDILASKIAKKWDFHTAEHTVLNAKIKWYYTHKDYYNLIKYQIEKLDKDTIPIGQWEAYQINNFVWDIVLKYTNDSSILLKASDYMKKVTHTFPNDYEKIDTYANVLYKLGQKDQAIHLEKKALLLAESSNDESSVTIFKNTLKKMSKNELIANE